MPRHQDKDVSFDPPADWGERTFIAFTAPPNLVKDAKTAPNVVMTREPMRQGDSLRVHSDRQLIDLGKQLKDFDLLESGETLLGGLPAITTRFRWTSQVGVLEQAMVVVERPGPQVNFVTTFTTTMTPADAPYAGPAFEDILRTVRFAPVGGGGPPPPPTRPTLAPPPPVDSTPMVPMPGRRGDPGGRR